MNIYIDGIFDLFHSGHVEHFKKVKYLDGKNNNLIVGIISDKNAEGYKRKPIYDEKTRHCLIESCKYVNKIVEDAPLILTEEFLNINEIDLVCHAFADETDLDKQLEFFKVPIRMNKFRKVKYNQGISTTNIINKIKREY